MASPHAVVAGAARVAGNLLRFWGPEATLVSFPGGPQPALLGFIGRELRGVLVLSMRGERIQSVHVIADPAALAFVSAQLAVTFSPAAPSLPVPPAGGHGARGSGRAPREGKAPACSISRSS